MITPEFVQYIKQRIASGEPVVDIRRVVREGGWQDSDFDEALAEIKKAELPPPPPIATTPVPDVVSPVAVLNIQQSQKFPLIFFLRIIVVFLIIVLSAGGVYMYAMKLGPFATAPYAEENLLPGLAMSISNIHSVSYSVSASLMMNKRDADAIPFVTKLPEIADIEKRYQDDVKRAQDVSSILTQLRYFSDGKGHGALVTYPDSLKSLGNNKNYGFYNIPITDPSTEKPYNYSVTNGGKNFSLSVVFGSDEAISQIRQSYVRLATYSSSTLPVVNGREVIFTKDSYEYFQISSTRPKPFLVGLADYLAYISAETKVSVSLGAQTDFSGTSADWRFNADATGDFGDLSYKVNADALSKDGIYYFRINNLPAIFSSYLGFDKGQWVKIDPSKTASSSGLYYGSFESQLPDAEKQYKEHRQELIDLLKKMVVTADDNKLISLKRPVYSEKVDGRDLYRYDLAVNKESLVPFYKSLQAEIDKTTIKNSFPLLNDDSYFNSLQSPEFVEVFDYYQKNTSLTVWVDGAGFPAMVSYSMRVVPPDSATTLKEKQADLVFTLKLSDINKPVDISVPAGALDLQAMQSDITTPVGLSAAKGRDARRIADTGQIQQALALHYDTKGFYPKNLQVLVTDKFLASEPVDPKTNEKYLFAVSSDALSYHLGARLEMASDTAMLSYDKDCSSAVGGSPLCSGFSSGVAGGFSGVDPVYDVTP